MTGRRNGDLLAARRDTRLSLGEHDGVNQPLPAGHSAGDDAELLDEEAA